MMDILAIEQAKAELIEEYVAILLNEALYGKATIIRTTHTFPDGTIAEETITKTEPPNAVLASEILQRLRNR